MESKSVTKVRAPRSGVSSGRRKYVALGDGRSVWARRHADILALHVNDLGGEGALSEAQLSLARRAATLSTELERFEAQLSVGEDIDLDLYGRTTGQLRRVLESIGLQRAKRDLIPNPLVDHFSRPHARAPA